MPTTPIVDPAAEARARPQAPRIGLLQIDPIMFLAVIALGVCSYTAIGETRFADLAQRQGIVFGFGLLLALVISQVDYSRLRELKWALYGLMIGAILVVLTLGGDTRGSRRAIQLGFAELQASEFGKVLLMLVLAAFLVDRARHMRDRDTTARAMLIALVPTAMVLGSDLGSGLVYVVISLAALFVAGTSWKHFAALFSLGAIAIALTLIVLPQAGVTVLKEYQVERLTSFLHPSEDPGDAGYQQEIGRASCRERV